MRNLWFVWVWIAALFVLNVAARAQEIDYNDPNDPYYQITEIQNEPVSVDLEPATPEKLEEARQAFATKYQQSTLLQEIAHAPSSGKRNLGPRADESHLFAGAMGIGPWAIAQLIFKAWDIVLQGKPVVNIEVKNASALPVMADYNWAMLTGWYPERVVRRQLRIKNLLGGHPIEMDTAVKLMFGGSARGRGMYIASARVVPSNVHVNWGYNMDVSVNVPAVVNVSGREDDPIAQITLEVTYKIQSQIAGLVIKKSEWKDVYKVQGDGYFLDYTRGKEYFQPVYHAPAPPLPSPTPTPEPVLPTDPGTDDPLLGGGGDDLFGTPTPTPAKKPPSKKPAATPSPTPAKKPARA